MKGAFAPCSTHFDLPMTRIDVASFSFYTFFRRFSRGSRERFLTFCDRVESLRTWRRLLSKRLLRAFGAVVSLSVAFAACKKNSQVPAPAVPEVAKATPIPSTTPAPNPINLKSQVIVLCYHRFEERPKDSLAIKPAEFEAQMQALKDHGITVISMEDFLAWKSGEKPIPEKAALITIDDGYLSGYKVAWPILKKFGYPFTMFIYTDYIKGGPKSGGQSMSWNQLADMRDEGVDIESHTISHSSLNARKGKTDEEYLAWLKNEIAGSKELLEKNLGIQVNAFAYPYGLNNATVRDLVKQTGYQVAFTVWGRRIGYGADPMTIGRYGVESTKPKIFEEAVNFTGAVDGESADLMPAAPSIATQPGDGETVTGSPAEIKANLATFGNVDPKSVTMRISGIGLVQASYDPETKFISYKLANKIYARQVTVIVAATVNAKKIEARWSFNIVANEAPEKP
jgi:peptidoglycan/xylan/chitin deacetylase (PgdA/CDA1 family)